MILKGMAVRPSVWSQKTDHGYLFADTIRLLNCWKALRHHGLKKERLLCWFNQDWFQAGCRHPLRYPENFNTHKVVLFIIIQNNPVFHFFRAMDANISQALVIKSPHFGRILVKRADQDCTKMRKIENFRSLLFAILDYQDFFEEMAWLRAWKMSLTDPFGRRISIFMTWSRGNVEKHMFWWYPFSGSGWGMMP